MSRVYALASDEMTTAMIMSLPVKFPLELDPNVMITLIKSLSSASAFATPLTEDEQNDALSLYMSIAATLGIEGE
ncbi:hypothetical protein [Streptomyces phytophilus]|uniref:hypothetical protein n=1 Tax=Streptomyces phytophilus TaxID=722715 RepID=UPI0015F0F0EE|nr:hypothetical protein [Streptomyces phytophilus]